jgi:hypothetical protein
MFLDDLIADGGKILWPGCGNAASQVEQGICQRLQDDFIPSLYESDPVAFLEVERSADLPWNSHLASAAYSANDHHTYLLMAAVLASVRHTEIIPVNRAIVKRRIARRTRIVLPGCVLAAACSL